MRLSVDTVAGTRGFAVAPIERFTVSSNGLIQLNGDRRLYEEISLDEKGTTALVGDYAHRQNQSPNPTRSHIFRTFNRIGRALRAFVRMVAIVVRSGGQSVVQARCCLGSWQRLFIAEVREGWKDRTHLASPVNQGIA
jgi:thiamine phosphate synthase YjbQ (UPF0047 family)